MKFILPLLFFLFFSFPVNAQNIPYLDGVPLLEGFVVSNDDILVFDKPEGRIVEVIAWCDTNCPSMDQTYKYYETTLTSLGWSAFDVSSYQKGSNTLTLDYKRDDQSHQTILIFRSEN
jgi:hypothetical protein